MGTSAARSTVDILLAARQLYPAIGTRWAVMGHAQGGHAALFTASLAPDWAAGLDLIGAVAIAPAGGAHNMIAGLQDIRTPAPALGFAALVLIGAAVGDHRLRLDQMLTPAALCLLARAETDSIDDLLTPGLPPQLVPADVFRPGTDLSPLLKILRANDPATLRLRTPTLVVQGDDDPIVAPSSTDHIAHCLRASGAMLVYRRYPGQGHFDLIEAAHNENAQWIDARLAETPSRRATREPQTH